MPRGGVRTGKQGSPPKANRSDMNQPPLVAPSQAYGQRQAAIESQQAAPLPKAGAAPTSPAVAGPSSPAGPPSPGGLGGIPAGPGLLDPSSRPDEPIQAGLSMGPGGGPEMLGATEDPREDALLWLRAQYKLYPTEGIREAIEDLEAEM